MNRVPTLRQLCSSLECLTILVPLTGLSLAIVGCSGGSQGKGTPNSAPVFTSTALTSAKEGHPYSYTPVATDADRDALKFTLVAGPAGAALTGGAVTWTPAVIQIGTPQAFKVHVADPKGGGADQEWVVVPGANGAPTLNSTAPASAKVGHPYTYTPSATDSDGDATTFSLLGGPAGATLEGETLHWTPTVGQAGAAQAFLVRASDGFGGTRDQAWTITPDPNAAPTFTLSPPPSAREGSTYTYTGSTTDADGDLVSLALITAPAGATLTDNTLTWTPSPAQLGVAQSFLLRASDGFGGTQELAWTVTPAVNHAPQISSQPNLVAVRGSEYVYIVAATDADGDALTYAVLLAPAGATLTGTTLRWSPDSAQVGVVQTFQIRVTDAYGKSFDQTWTLTPRAGNSAPVITSSAPLDVNGAGQYTYPLAATDVDGDPVSFSLTEAPAGAKVEGNTLTWTPSPEQTRRPQTLTVRASDSLGASTHQSWTLSATGPVQGMRLFSWVSDSGTTQTPDDTGAMVLAAHVPNGSGGFTTLPGSGGNDGHITIPAVKAGYYWFQFGADNFIWTDTSQMDLGYSRLGRSNVQKGTSDATQLSLNVTGLNPWQMDDDLQWINPNAGHWWESQSQIDPTNPPGTGVTALAGTTWSWKDQALSNAASGDHPYLTQLATQTINGERVQVLKKALGVSGFTQPDGVLTTFSGTLSEVPQASTFHLDWKRAQFLNLLTQVNPEAIFGGAYFYLDAQPYGSDRVVGGGTPDLIMFNSFNSTDVDFGPIAFGNPFPATWTLFTYAFAGYYVRFTAQGATTRTNWTEVPFVMAPAGGGATIQPLLGPVKSPSINGNTLLLPQSGVGTTPTLSWQPPTLGTPTGYIVEIRNLWLNGTGSKLTRVATLRTKTTSIQVPPGILVAGKTYALAIRAQSQPGVDLATGPYRGSATRAGSSLISNTFIP